MAKVQTRQVFTICRRRQQVQSKTTLNPTAEWLVLVRHLWFTEADIYLSSHGNQVYQEDPAPLDNARGAFVSGLAWRLVGGFMPLLWVLSTLHRAHTV